MRVNSGSDWRDALPFETPVELASVVPGDPTRCVGCGAAAEPKPRDQLFAYKHRHPRDHSGYVRFYCGVHVPAAAAPPVVAAAVPVRASRSSRSPRAERVPVERTPRRPTAVERPRAVCPTCFVEVPPTGICGSCGEPVD